jgi:hypothetical protein
MIILIKVEKKTKKIFNQNSNETYEKLLQQLESEVRKNIAIQNQLKVQIQQMQFDATVIDNVSLLLL